MGSGKKKTSKSSRKGGGGAFGGIGDMDDKGSMVDNSISVHRCNDEDERVIRFSGNAFGAFGGIGDVDDNGSMVDDSFSVNRCDDEDEPVIRFSGKKKSSKADKMGCNGVVSEHVSGFSVEDTEDDIKEEDEDTDSIIFTGKKKSSKKNATGLFSALLLNEEGDNDDVLLSETDVVGDHSTITQEENTATTVYGVVDSALVETPSLSVEHSVSVSTIETEDSKRTQAAEESRQVSKNQKKKKKSGRTVQEEDDIDKILAELGEGPSTLKQPFVPVPAVALPEEKVEMQPGVEDGAGEKEGEEQGPVESAAAKKKKRKKDKEKEKKLTTTDEKQEAKSGIVLDNNQKVSKHVRGIRESIAKLKEVEERKKKEEEEKLMKEEEERRRQEELERQAEEKKRLKKQKEKEKLLKKKQEGEFKTAKQKEEDRRRETMRKQIVNKKGGLPLPSGDTGGAQTKRPKYQTKKSKPQSHAANGGASDADLIVRGNDDELQNAEEPQENDDVDSNEVKDEKEEDDDDSWGVKSCWDDEDDDDDSWDIKSCWDDDDDIKLRGKSKISKEESSDSEFEPAVQKEVKSVGLAKSDVGPSGTKPTVDKKVTPSVPLRSQKVDLTKSTPEVEVSKSEDDHISSKAGNNLRSPICCIMGHVDTGKTKLLDCIRGTNVQEGEAGGITQQIGATYFPAENIRERTKELKADAKLNVPGLLVIDTPGHESFTNLRSRGSGLCDLAILVVDIMHGLEPQTIESLNLLKMRNTNFIVALNKVDRLYGWKAVRNAPIQKTMKQQSKDVIMEFNSRVTQVVTQFKEQGVNTALYYKNKEMRDTVSIVPTSAISGEGVPDLLLLLVKWAEKTMIERLTYSNEVECTVLEVKVVEGLGTTIDVVLVNGVLHEGEQIVVCGMQGPIVTSIRELLTPRPMRELRVKGTYLHHKEIKAAQCIKISAQGLEHAIAGTGLYVVGPKDDLDSIKETAMDDMKSVMNRIDKSGNGVYVQASTLGSLEALLEFLKTPVVNIPVSGIGIGPVHKKDVVKASVMLEKKKKEFATILAFDITVTSEAKELADALGVKIFCADIIYHLFDQFKAYIDNLKEEKKKEASEEAVFPCILRIVPEYVFNKKDPIVLGVDVLQGIAKVGTPICVPQKEFIEIGRIASIENNHKQVDFAKKGQKVAIKIVGSNPEEKQKMFGRHFDSDDELVSRITRRSIDLLKENYRNDLSKEEWRLVNDLKKFFKIQ